MSFTTEFKKLREAIGTQKEVSELLDIHSNSVSEFEIGKRIPIASKQRAYLQIMSDKVIEIAQSEVMRKRSIQGIV